MKWITQDIVQLLSDDAWTIEVQDPGGDWDTETLYIHHKKAKKRVALFVAGWRYLNEPAMTTPGEAEVNGVYVTDGNDSRGGLNVDCEHTAHMYATVCTKLRKAGFYVSLNQEQ